MSIRILLADDHVVLREGLRALLEKQPDMLLVGEASHGREAVALAEKLRPAVIVMDIAMPGLNGIEATRQIVKNAPRTRVLALSMHTDKRFVAGMLKAGAAGYMLKDGAAEELVTAIRAIAVGGTYLSPRIAGPVVQGLVSPARPEGSASKLALTVREREVLQLLAEGKSTKEIAHALIISTKTVETYRHRIMDKSGLRTVAELTKLAVREGLTFLDS